MIQMVNSAAIIEYLILTIHFSFGPISGLVGYRNPSVNCSHGSGGSDSTTLSELITSLRTNTPFWGSAKPNNLQSRNLSQILIYSLHLSQILI